MQRTALFGGTFNPVHLGHLRAAEEVREGFGLDKIYFIPAASPPHKGNKELAPAADRYEMLVRATKDNPDFTVSDLELKREGRSYTIDTVEQFSVLLPEQTCCYLVMGIDAFAEIDTWKSFQELFDRIEVIVISRPHAGAGGKDLQAELEEVISGRISEGYQYDPETRRFVNPEKCAIYPFEITALDVSATRIRSLAATQASIRYLVPGGVDTYIYKKGLYL